MKLFFESFFVLAMFVGFTANAGELQSVYTDLKKDCVDVSVSNDKSEIDFFESTCKSFGGYEMGIKGSDLRYAPILSYGGQAIDFDVPGSFHEMGSDKVEWLYDLEVQENGIGALAWKALIYRLNVYDSETQKDVSLLYVVRLDGVKSCGLGTAKTNEEARKMAATGTCLKQGEERIRE